MSHSTHALPKRRLLVLLLTIVGSLGTAQAADKKRVIVVALDSSGSMAQTDPARRRVEAAKMLLSAANPSDEVGVIVFGDRARWLVSSETNRRSDFSLDELEKVGQADKHTDFADLIQFWSDFLSSKPPGYFDTHEADLVLLTDGLPDPLGESAADNARRSLSLARTASAYGRIYTIALGSEARKSVFLNQLAETSRGSSAIANSESDLTTAFLQIATRVLRLPAYQRLDQPGSLSDFGTPTRALLIFLGLNDLTVVGGRSLLNSPSAKVIDLSGVKPGTVISWRGPGAAFYCISDPLIVSLDKALPGAVLTNSSMAVRLHLTSSNDQLSIVKPYFLEGADVQVVAIPQSGSMPQKVSLDRGDNGVYDGMLSISEPGSYELFSKLSANYGELNQPLTRLIVTASPVIIPPQITIPIFDPLPRSWFSYGVLATQAVPTGAAKVTFEPESYLAARPALAQLTIGETKQVQIDALSPFEPGTLQVLKYQVSWNDGNRVFTINGETKVYLQQLTWYQLIKAKWIWLLAAITGFIAFIWLVRALTPRPLRGKLQVSQDGNLLTSIDMPRERRTRQLTIRVAQAPLPSGSSKSVLLIEGNVNEEIVTLISQRQNGRWTTVIKPGPLGVETPNGLLFQATDLRKIAHRSVLSQDRKVEISLR